VPLVVHLQWGLRHETLSGVRRAVVRLFEGVATRFSHAVVPNSASLAAVLVREGLAREARVTVVGAGSSHGVDTEYFRPGAAGPRSPALDTALAALGPGPVVGFVGRLTSDKGVDTLLAATDLLHRPDRPVRLLLVGGGEDEALGRRVASAAAGGLPVARFDAVEDLRPFYGAMDVHCLPTLREGFPNVCLEAAASGLPTVTTDATGAVDSVVDGVTGSIVPREDPAALAAALDALLDDPVRRHRMGAAAREWATTEFEAERVWKAHAELLRSLLDGRRARRRAS
jgi:glycosyltransferase involved in cell wall biosynthesis